MILQINFKLNVPVAEYQSLANSVAQAFADLPGLKWKIWLLNEATHEAGGIYLFDSQSSLDDYLNGPLLAQVKTMPALSDISVKQFDVMTDVTTVTHGPVAALESARA